MVIPAWVIGLLGGVVLALVLILAAVVAIFEQEQQQCGAAGSGSAGGDAHVGQPLVLQPGQAASVAATTYGGTYGSITGFPGQSHLPSHPDTFAELSTLAVNPYPNFQFSDADALNQLPYMTALRVSRNGRSMILYKRDVGFGQGRNTLDGHAARIDVYEPAAQTLGVSYSMVNVSLVPRTGAGGVLQATPGAQDDRRIPVQAGFPDAGTGGQDAAISYIQGRRGRAAFAVVQPDGTVVASYRPDMLFHSASLTKAMILVALTRSRESRVISSTVRGWAQQMIRDSDNAAANAVLHEVGTAAVQEVARAAGMRDFRLSTSDPVYRLGDSLISAGDQARFFAQLNRLIPERHRDWALELFGTERSGQWGLVEAGLPGTLYAKAGWRPEPNGEWTVTQAGQIASGANRIGIAVLTDGNPNEAYGHETIRDTARSLLSDSRSAMVSCGGAVGAGPLPLTPGSRARILPNGMAAAPREAPEPVKQIIAAANQIIDRPYVYGGGHMFPVSRLAPSYDCSSSVSHALGGAGLLTFPMVSGALALWGASGPGQWVTIEANADHVYMYVAGLRFDTSDGYGGGNQPPGSGPRWRSNARPNTGFVTRHPPGL